MVEERSVRDRVIRLCIYVFLVFLAVICLLPFLQVIAKSCSGKEAVARREVLFWPVDFSLDNYGFLVSSRFFRGSFWVSARRVVLGVFLNLLVSVITAYPLSRDRIELPGRGFFRLYLVVAMLFGGGLIPTYLAYKSLGLIDNFLVLVLPGAMSVWYVILVANFFRGLPAEISEAAVIDGANDFDILLRLFLPLSKPSLATVALFAAVSHWNSWFDGILYMNQVEKWPLQSYVYAMVTAQSMRGEITQQAANEELFRRFKDVTPESMQAAMLVTAAVPIMLVYPFLQRFFVTGLTLGAVKG